MKTTSVSSPASWLRLAEYGDWPHPRGLQRFTPAAANTMVQYFKSLRGRLARKFGGLPVYIGHPDDAQFYGQSGHTDTRAYAWVTELEARRDGLYGAFKWSAAGEELLHNAFYKFLSPRWAMEPLGTDAFQPVRLLSVGLTNQPNIPGEAIANGAAAAQETESHAPTTHGPAAPLADAHNTTSDNTLPDARNTAHLSSSSSSTANDSGSLSPAANDSVSPSCATDNNAHLSPSSGCAADNPAPFSSDQLRTALGIGEGIDPLEAIAELREQSERFYRIACEQSDRLSHESVSLANAQRQHVSLVVQNALLAGRIAPHESEGWQQRFTEDWDGAQAALNARQHTLKTTAIANTRAPLENATTHADDFLARVEAHAKANQLNFAQAWCDLKRRQPALYQQFFAHDG